MCELCMQEPCAWGCPNAGLLREHPVCSWCCEPIMDAAYYEVDGDIVCTDCMEACRRYTFDM